MRYCEAGRWRKRDGKKREEEEEEEVGILSQIKKQSESDMERPKACELMITLRSGLLIKEPDLQRRG